ncbi:MAG: alpha-N-arabinofuranosidase, partial [Anaerolineales bacterium]|nr:alpha-N-arabinofuranosidase [Anaerolineales bacterium]
FKIAGGANVDDYHWTETLMSRTRGGHGKFLMKGLSLHYYSRGDNWPPRLAATGFAEAEWFNILSDARYMEELLQRHSTIMDQYDPEKEVGLIVDEWGTWYTVEPGTNPGFLYQQNTMRDALVAALHFDIFHRYCDRVQMTNIAQTVNVLQAMILTEEGGDRMILTPTYHVFDMYKVHQDATLLPLTLASDEYTYGDSAIPAISATASRDSAGRVHISLSNSDPHTDHTVVCSLRGIKANIIAGRILTAVTMDAHNTFDEPDRVQPVDFNGASLDGDQLTIQMPAKSVVTLAIGA